MDLLIKASATKIMRALMDLESEIQAKMNRYPGAGLEDELMEIRTAIHQLRSKLGDL
ncbi:MAG: hypothetical protein ACM3PP_11180 [Candidatus Saccharibacteria bacterium]